MYGIRLLPPVLPPIRQWPPGREEHAATRDFRWATGTGSRGISGLRLSPCCLPVAGDVLGARRVVVPCHTSRTLADQVLRRRHNDAQ